jgi:hypothetical protein
MVRLPKNLIIGVRSAWAAAAEARRARVANIFKKVLYWLWRIVDRRSLRWFPGSCWRYCAVVCAGYDIVVILLRGGGVGSLLKKLVLVNSETERYARNMWACEDGV